MDIQPTPIIGQAPPPEFASDFQSDEAINKTGIAQTLCELPLIVELKRRKIYAWIWTAVSNTTDNYIKARINFYRNQQKVGSLPLSFGNASGVGAKLNTTLASVSVTGGSILADCLGITIGNVAAGQPVSVVLQPQIIIGRADSASISIDELWNVTSYRVYFAVISSNK